MDAGLLSRLEERYNAFRGSPGFLNAETESIVRKVLDCVGAAAGILVESLDGETGTLAIIHREATYEPRSFWLDAEHYAVLQKSFGQDGRINTQTINTILHSLQEGPCETAVGWRFTLDNTSSMLIVTDVIGYKESNNHVTTRLLERTTECLIKLLIEFIAACRDKQLFMHALECISNINKAVLEGKAPDAIFEYIIAKLSSITGAKTGGLLLYERETGCLALQRPAFGCYDENTIARYRVSLNDGGNAVQVFQTRQGYFSNRVCEDPRFIKHFLEIFPAQNVLSAPILVNNECIGVLHLTDKPGGFSKNDLDVVNTVLSQLAVVIENVRLFCRLKLEQNQSKTLYELSKEFHVTDIERFTNFVVGKILETLGFDLAIIALRTDFPELVSQSRIYGRITAEAGRKRPGWINRVISLPVKEIEIMDLSAMLLENLDQLENEARRLGMRMEVRVLIGTTAVPLGALWIWDAKVTKLSHSQIQFLFSAVNQVAVALDNFRNYMLEKQTSARLKRFLRIGQRLVSLILKGADFQFITETLSRFLKSGVIFYNYRAIRKAWAQVSSDVLTQIDNYLMDMISNNRLNSRASSPVSWNYISDKGMVLASIQIAGEQLGFLCILRNEWDEDIRAIIEYVLPVYALELLKERFAQELTQSVESEFMSDLLSDKRSEDEILQKAHSLGYDLHQPHVIVVGQAEHAHHDYQRWLSLKPSWLSELRASLRSSIGNSLVTTFQGDLIMLIPVHDGQEACMNELLESVVRECEALYGNSLCLGVGRVAQCIGELKRSYKEACFALRYAKTLGGKKAVIAFHNLGLYQALLDDSVARSLSEFMWDLLGPLLSMDQQKRAAYLKTLDRYLASGGSIRKTARWLFCHLNTVRYRLHHIKQLLKTDLNHEDTRFNIQMALKLARFYHPEFFS